MKLTINNPKSQILEGKVEEKTSEATMEKQRAVRAEDMLKSEKKEFQRQLQDRIDELRNTHSNEIMQLKQEISKAKESLQERERTHESRIREAKFKAQKLEQNIKEKGESIMQLIQSHKDDMNKMNERREEERLKYEKQIENCKKS